LDIPAVYLKALEREALARGRSFNAVCLDAFATALRVWDGAERAQDRRAQSEGQKSPSL